MALPDFHNASVLVVGDVMLDRYLHGQASRISPEAPVPVVHVHDSQEFPGGAGNVALNIRSLGSQVTLLGIIGEDLDGKTLQKALTLGQINSRLKIHPTAQTITKLRVLSHHQQLIRLDFEEEIKVFQNENIFNDYQQLLPHVNCVILSDYGKGTLSQVEQLIEAAKKRQCPVFVDPKGMDFSRYAHATLLSPNRKEFEAVVGHCATEQILIERGLNLLNELNLNYLLITRGAEGMTLLQNEHPALHLHADSKEVFDVSGAGDTVIGVLSCSYAAGAPIEEAVKLANAAAGVVVTKLGTATVTPQELVVALHPPQLSEQGITHLQQLQTNLIKARHRGERIVMTNGCFDLLHVGHIEYLKEAKALGDRLIVAVNDDQSVARLKGNSRPIVPLAGRMGVLAGLSSVDWVIPFSEDTPAELIKQISPDVLVKGGDYKISDIAGSDWVLAQGGQVRVLSFVDGWSTSSIIEKIAGELV